MRYVVAINVMLALFFSAQTVGLYHRIDTMKQVKFNQPVHDFSEFQRRPIAMPETLNHVFGTSKATGTGNDVKDSGQADLANETQKTEGTLRLRGIFITDEGRNAYLSVIGPKGRKTDPSLQFIKLKTGDQILDLIVTQILSDRLVLSSGSSSPLTLKIYKPLMVTQPNG